MISFQGLEVGREDRLQEGEGIFEGDEYFLQLDCGHDYMIIVTFQNSSNCTIKKGEFKK